MYASINKPTPNKLNFKNLEIAKETNLNDIGAGSNNNNASDNSKDKDVLKIMGGNNSITLPSRPQAIPPVRSSSLLLNSPALENPGNFPSLASSAPVGGASAIYSTPSSVALGGGAQLDDRPLGKTKSSGKDYIMYDSDIYAEVYSEALDPPNGFARQAEELVDGGEDVDSDALDQDDDKAIEEEYV